MKIKLLIKAIFIGIAKIIPGLSGTILMMSFNLYEKALLAITKFFENPKKNFIFLTNLAIGILIGILLFSNLVKYCLANYYIYTISLFIGLILGGIIPIKKEIRPTLSNYLYITISFLLMYILTTTNNTNLYIIKNNYFDLITFFISGLLEALGTIVPGVSSTALLMLVGIYPYYIDILSNLLNINYLLKSLNFILPFLIGLVLGIIILSLLICYLLKYHKQITYSFILGLSLSTVLTLLIAVITQINTIISFLINTLLLIIGFLLTNKIN